MSTFNEDRILDFLDGRLSSGEEEELLHTLAVSPERRGILRAHMRLREVTSNIATTERLAVPKHVTSQLFSTLGAMGLKATASTESILTQAPQLAKMSAAARFVPALASSAAVGAAATAVNGSNLSFASIVGATLLSFTLGIGAYHVFANGLGVRPIGDVPAAQIAAHQESTTSIQHSGLMADATPIQSLSTDREAPLSPVTLHFMTPLPINGDALRIEYPFDAGEPITYAAPLEKPIAPVMMDAPARLASQRVLARAIESPVEKPKGTVSLRYGTGVMPTNLSLGASSLEEMKFRWTALDYIVGQASLGQLQTSIHQANAPDRSSPNGPSNEITIGTTSTNNLLMGVEGGFTLDPIHLPIEGTMGVMIDAADKFYYRAGLFGHYEPFEAMSIVFGFEGLWFTNDISTSVKNVRDTYSSFVKPNALVKGQGGTETAGFFGPSIELGWHF